MAGYTMSQVTAARKTWVSLRDIQVNPNWTPYSTAQWFKA